MKYVRPLFTSETGLPRLDFTRMLEKVMHYKPMDPVVKHIVVTTYETKIREAAWYAGKLNPLIGTDKVSTEPIWDSERNIIQ